MSTCSDNSIHPLAEKLLAGMSELVPCVIAYSGGVDSAVVAAAAVRAERPGRSAAQSGTADGAARSVGRSIAVTAISPAVPEAQREIARRVAAEIGIEHRFIATEELTRDDYSRNDPRRCFFCKQTLYGALQPVAIQRSAVSIVSGTNADDLGDYRPGIEAGRAVGVRMPLAELGIGKAAVREIAALWELTVSQLPAAPCLASRVAYGVAVTQERLRMIELAEQWLGQQGFSPLRVRLHEGEFAKIEVPLEDLPRLVQRPLIERVGQRFSELGFRAVAVDLAGFRSGSMNQLFNLSPPETQAR